MPPETESPLPRTVPTPLVYAGCVLKAQASLGPGVPGTSAGCDGHSPPVHHSRIALANARHSYDEVIVDRFPA